MISREELLNNQDYWLETLQNDLYREVTEYLQSENITQKELADKMGVSKGYVSQILNGNFNHTIKKLIELSLAIGSVPIVKYKKVADIIEQDHKSRAMYSTAYTFNQVVPFPIVNGECNHEQPTKFHIKIGEGTYQTKETDGKASA